MTQICQIRVWLYSLNYMHFSSYTDGNKQASSGYTKLFPTDQYSDKVHNLRLID